MNEKKTCKPIEDNATTKDYHFRKVFCTSCWNYYRINSEDFARRPDIEIKFIRNNGKWRVKIGDGAISQIFDTFFDALDELPEYFDGGFID